MELASNPALAGRAGGPAAARPLSLRARHYTVYPVANASNLHLALGDMDGDGDLDVITTNSFSPSDSEVSVLRNN